MYTMNACRLIKKIFIYRFILRRKAFLAYIQIEIEPKAIFGV